MLCVLWMYHAYTHMRSNVQHTHSHSHTLMRQQVCPDFSTELCSLQLQLQLQSHERSRETTSRETDVHAMWSISNMLGLTDAKFGTARNAVVGWGGDIYRALRFTSSSTPHSCSWWVLCIAVTARHVRQRHKAAGAIPHLIPANIVPNPLLKPKQHSSKFHTSQQTFNTTSL